MSRRDRGTEPVIIVDAEAMLLVLLSVLLFVAGLAKRSAALLAGAGLLATGYVQRRRDH